MVDGVTWVKCFGIHCEVSREKIRKKQHSDYTAVNQLNIIKLIFIIPHPNMLHSCFTDLAPVRALAAFSFRDFTRFGGKTWIEVQGLTLTYQTTFYTDAIPSAPWFASRKHLYVTIWWIKFGPKWIVDGKSESLRNNAMHQCHQIRLDFRLFCEYYNEKSNVLMAVCSVW